MILYEITGKIFEFKPKLDKIKSFKLSELNKNGIKFYEIYTSNAKSKLSEISKRNIQNYYKVSDFNFKNNEYDRSVFMPQISSLLKKETVDNILKQYLLELDNRHEEIKIIEGKSSIRYYLLTELPSHQKIGLFEFYTLNNIIQITEKLYILEQFKKGNFNELVFRDIKFLKELYDVKELDLEDINKEEYNNIFDNIDNQTTEVYNMMQVVKELRKK